MKKTLARLFKKYAANLLRNLWAKPFIGIILALVTLSLMLWLDRNGLSSALQSATWPFSMTGETVKETATALAAVIASLLALFFSITLIVLTMASSSLGVRLIDRWIANRTIQTTLSLLIALLTFSVVLLGAVDPDGPDERIPRGSLLCLIAVLLATIPWLAYAFNHLSRRIHVDFSIVDISDGLRQDLARVRGYEIVDGPTELDDPYQFKVEDAGYLEYIDTDEIVTICEKHDLQVIMEVQEGEFLMKDDVLLHISPNDVDEKVRKSLARSIEVGGFRTDRQGARFRTRLLAEIAARAMSPAVNDYYTAFACLDHLAGAFTPFLESAPSDGWIATEDGRPALSVKTRPTEAILKNPLLIMRHSVSPYPAVALYQGELLTRLIKRCRNKKDEDFLKAQLSQLVRASLENCHIEEDRDALKALLDNTAD